MPRLAARRRAAALALLAGSRRSAGAAPSEAAPGTAGTMSLLFTSWEDVASASGVGGSSWTELEERCQPGAGPGQSQGGWISDGTPILDVLKADWEAVRRMGTTHVELVGHLDAIWAQATPCKADGTTEISYDPSTLEGNTLDGAGPARLKLSCLVTRGIQEDLLTPYDWSEGWNAQWSVESPAGKLQIGGRNSSAGILRYAKMFGFYEGGKDNEFRVDPVRLVRMLTQAENGQQTGKVLPSAVQGREIQIGDALGAEGSEPPWWSWMIASIVVFSCVWALWVALSGHMHERTIDRVPKRTRFTGMSDEVTSSLVHHEMEDPKTLLATRAAASTSATGKELPPSSLAQHNAADEWARLMSSSPAAMALQSPPPVSAWPVQQYTRTLQYATPVQAQLTQQPLQPVQQVFVEQQSLQLRPAPPAQARGMRPADTLPAISLSQGAAGAAASRAGGEAWQANSF